MPTESVSRIAASGGDYTSLEAWDAAEAADLVAADLVAVAEIDDDFAAGLPVANTRIQDYGWNTDATRNIVIRPVAGKEWDHAAQTGAYFARAQTHSFGIAMYVPEHITIQDLGYKNAASATYYNGFSNNAGANLTVQRLAFYNVLPYLYGGSVGDAATRLLDSLYVGSAAAGYYPVYRATVQRCTFIGKGSGIDRIARDCVLTDCALYNETGSPVYGNLFNCTDSYCASSDSTVSGTGSLRGLAAGDFADYAGGDYSPAAGSILLGASSTGDAIGAFQAAASGPQTIAAGLSAEADAALGVLVAADVALGLGLATGAEAALPAAARHVAGVGLAADAHAALAALAARAVRLDAPQEAVVALPATALKAAAVGLAGESEAAFSATALVSRVIAVAQALGTAVALPVTGQKAAAVGLAAESEQALLLAVPQTALVSLAQEVDGAAAVALRRLVAAAQASESSGALGARPAKAVAGGLASESSLALGVSVDGALIIYAEGLEYTAPENRLHYTLVPSRLHYTLH